jgi:hypothetical protein
VVPTSSFLFFFPFFFLTFLFFLFSFSFLFFSSLSSSLSLSCIHLLIVFICACRWLHQQHSLRKDFSKWPAPGDCHEKYKDGTEDEDFHQLTKHETRRIMDIFAKTDVFNKLFLSLDQDATRKEANRAHAFRVAGVQAARKASFEFVGESLPASCRPAGVPLAEYKEDPTTREQYLRDHEPGVDSKADSWFFDLLDSKGHGKEPGDYATTADMCNLFSEMYRLIERNAFQAHRALWLSTALAKGLHNMGEGQLSRGPGRQPGRQCHEPGWVAELPGKLRNLAYQEVEITSHKNKDTSTQRKHRMARDTIFNELIEKWLEAGSWSKCDDGLKVRSCVLLGDAPLCWPWEQVGKKVTQHIAYTLHKHRGQQFKRAVSPNSSAFGSEEIKVQHRGRRGLHRGHKGAHRRQAT